MDSVELQRPRASAFVVDEGALRSLDAIVAPYTRDRRYRATTKQGITYALGSVQELIDMPNTRQRAIVAVELLALAEDRDFPPVVKVSLDLRNIVHVIRFSVSGDESKVHVLGGRLDEWIGEIRPWHSPLAVAMHFMGYAAAIVYWCVLSAAEASLLVLVPAQLSGRPIVSAIALIGLNFVLAALLTVAGPWLFPAGVFMIGGGRHRYHSILFWRNLLGIVIILGLLVSIAAGIIANRLTAR